MVDKPTSDMPLAGGSGGLTKLHKRALSAVAMIGTAIACAWIGGIAFALLLLAIGAVMMWEWLRMVGVPAARHVQVRVVGYGCIVLAVVLSVGAGPVAGLAAVLLGLVAVAVIEPRLLGVGMVYITVPIVVLIWLRGDTALGFVAVALIFAVVWATDTFAMVVGKLVGGPLIWPRISPNKTWAGAFGGLVAGGILGAAVAVFAVAPDHWLYGLVLGSVLSVCAQVGDFVESAVKRACDVKDTSGIIPGHGGVLDRMDGIVGATFGAGVPLALTATDAPDRLLVLGGF